jgi:hypothetical protein
MMLHQRQIIHGLINTITCRQCKPLLNSRHNITAGPRLKSTALFPCQILDSSGGDKTPVPLPKEAKVVVCGGGVMGAAVAYHLAELGWGPQTILIDKGR